MSGGRKKREGKAGRSKRRDRRVETPGLSAGQRSGQASAPPARGPQPAPPVEVNGWKLYTWAAFRDRWDELVIAVEDLRRRDPTGYKQHPQTRFLALLRKVVMQDIPRDPSDARYRQGKTLGSEYAYWRRAKFSGRFRLFFRYHSGARIIVYVWLNDEDTPRKAGSRTDVYATFRAMLEDPRDDELSLARDVMRRLYSTAGRDPPLYFPAKPLEETYDHGRMQWLDLFDRSKQATRRRDRERTIIEFGDDLQHHEIKRYLALLPQAIKTELRGKKVIVENSAELEQWLDDHAARRRGWFSGFFSRRG